MTVFTARAMLPVTHRLDHRRPRLSYFSKYSRLAHRLLRK